MAGSLRWLSPHPAGKRLPVQMPPTNRQGLPKNGVERQRLQQLDLLTYQIQELRAANLSAPDEFEQLELERQRSCCGVAAVELQVYQALYQNDSDAPASGIY